MQLTPPTKPVFYASVFLAIVAFLLYLLGVFGVIEGGFDTVAHPAFWAALLGWLAMTIGVAGKGF